MELTSFGFREASILGDIFSSSHVTWFLRWIVIRIVGFLKEGAYVNFAARRLRIFVEQFGLLSEIIWFGDENFIVTICKIYVLQFEDIRFLNFRIEWSRFSQLCVVPADVFGIEKQKARFLNARFVIFISGQMEEGRAITQVPREEIIRDTRVEFTV